VLVVIGASAGLGLSAAKSFIAAGARVVGIGSDTDHVRHAGDVLGEHARMFQADATEAQTAERAIADATNTFGRCDGLYHVAGGSGRRWGDGPLHEISDDGWRATLNLNLDSVFLSNRAAVRHFLKHNQPGTILNLASVLAWSPSPRHFETHAYATAKAAIIGLSRTAAASYAARGVRVNVLAPGLVETNMARRAATDPDIMEFITRKQPLDGGRIGQAEDLDDAAVFFMSDSSRFVTGQVLAVDGGWSVSEGQLSAERR
jgi:NAD(P)-dependent dehydrogenase (short-subunit alcohol dehydrogenase family)